MEFINFLKKIIPSYIIFLIKKKNFFNKKYFGLNNIDEKISKYLNYNNGFFVELGANDGITQSNTFYFEKNKKWRGILIEPVKKKFYQCLQARSKKNKFFNCACVSKKYKKNFVELIYSNLYTVTNDNKNLIKPLDHIKNDNLNFYENQNYFKVKAKTLDKVLNEANAPKLIDFLSIDTEGYELEVLEGINFKKYTFKFILIENRNPKIINSFLLKKNYSFIEKLSHHDYLFKKK